MKYFILKLINFYQNTFSPDHGFFVKFGIKKANTCVFYPTCSEYTVDAINKYGTLKGVLKGVRRILKCHPWQKNTIDYLK